MAAPLRFNSYLDASPALHRLADKAERQRALQRLYEQVAPPSLARASHVIDLEQSILLLAADNGAVAAKLRQLAPELTRSFRDKGSEVTGIQVRVQVTTSPPQHEHRHAELSAAAQHALEELAEMLPDSPLKSAVERFAALRDEESDSGR